MTPLAGEVAVVTGAGQGIGAAIALALAQAGARVAVTTRRLEAARETAAALGPGHPPIVLDVADSGSVEAAREQIVAELGVPTILVNNAGINRIAAAEELSDEDWAEVIDVNLSGVFRCCRAFGRDMLAAGRGSIVNIGSIQGPTIAMPGRVAYAASKGGIAGLTRTLAVEWARRGVRVNAVLPGPVLTPMVEKAIADGILDEQLIVGRTPSGRIGSPADIGEAVVLLCLPGARHVTGQLLAADGGYSTYGAAGPVVR